MNLYFINLFLILITIIALLGILIYLYRHLCVTATREFAVMVIFALIFSTASLFELVTNQYEQMVFWRNVAQIGNFFGPLAALYFSMTFAGHQTGKNKWFLLLLVIPVISITLYFTSDYQHLVRKSIDMVYIGGYPAIEIQSTSLGIIFVSQNFIVNLIAAFILLTMNATRIIRTQARIIAGGIIAITTLLWLKAAGVITNIDMSILYLPGLLIIMIGLFRYKILSISPIATSKVVEVIEEGIVVASTGGRIVDLNPSGRELFSRITTNSQLINNKDSGKKKPKPMGALKEAELIISSLFPAWSKYIESCINGCVEISIPLDSQKKFFKVNIYKLEDKKNNHIGCISIIRDITAEKAEKDFLETKAYTDALTGLYNYGFFKEALQREIDRHKRYKREFSIIMFDIDQFKNINDVHGHLAGDNILVAVAQATNTSFRHSDIVARYGGDEFAIMMPETGIEAAVELSERLLDKIKNMTINYKNKQIKIRISMGIAHYPLPDGSKTEILSAADHALYISKKKGRNRLTVYGIEAE